MRLKLYFTIWVTLIFLILGVPKTRAQEAVSDWNVEVALRMIGDNLLQISGDRTSRVLPIQKENKVYRMAFETPLEIFPDSLVATTKEVFKKAEILKDYVVKVIKCDTEEVVYSFKITRTEKAEIIPCLGRKLPESCYIINIGFLNDDKAATLTSNLEPDGREDGLSESNISKSILIAGIILGVSLLIFFFWYRKITKTQNTNIILLGNYRLDTLHGELTFQEQTIELTSKEVDLLMLLYKAVNTTVERDVILNKVWGDEGDYIGRTVDVFISKLRKKLELDATVKIINIRGIGYKLVVG